MNIRHCLFWFKNNTVTAVLKKNNDMSVMRFRGNETIPFTEKYWDDWCEYAGLCSNDKTDFCLIYDNMPDVSDRLMSMQCEPSESIWNGIKIQKVISMLNVAEPAEIRTESGELLCRAGSFRNADKADVSIMTARFINAEAESMKAEIMKAETAEKTPLIQYYVGEFKKYKESQKK